MNFFYFANSWAGQLPWLDATARVFYVASVPLCATLWLALLFLARENQATQRDGFIGVPPENFAPETSKIHTQAASKRAVVITTLLAFLLCGALLFALNWFAQNVLQTPILSPRPFVSHRVNLLVVEPNDNSFPSPEALLLGVLWIAVWAISCRRHWLALALGIAGCGARIFCGTHYFADVFVGFAVGAAVCASMMALCGVVLRFSTEPFRQRNWRLRFQSAISLAIVFSVFVAGAISLRGTPRLWTQWQNRALGPTSQTANSRDDLRDIEYSNEYANTHSKAAVKEGEGVSSAPKSLEISEKDGHGKEIPRIGVTTTGGFLPREETRLLRALRRAKLGHALISVDVAALRDGDFVQHCAAVRFHVRNVGESERRRVVQSAQRIVKIAFATNTALQNIDVTGVVINAPQRDGVRYPLFATGAIAVFTASVQRQNLWLARADSSLNARNADAGLWLRARSRLYFNERVLLSRASSSTRTSSTRKKTSSPTLPRGKGKRDKLKSPIKNSPKIIAQKAAIVAKPSPAIKKIAPSATVKPSQRNAIQMKSSSRKAKMEAKTVGKPLRKTPRKTAQ